MEVDPPTCAASAVNTSSASTSNPVPGTSTQPPPETDEFLQTGRVGRRNAGKMLQMGRTYSQSTTTVPDINEDGSARLSTADLPMELEKLSCSGL